MPLEVIGREIVRGTICRDRWRAEVLLVCSDRIPLGERSPLLIRIRWRAEEEGGEAVPSEEATVSLTLRRSSEVGTGSIRFDGPGGEQNREFTGDGEVLLQLFGEAATAGDEADLSLEVRIGGELRKRVPLSVGEPGQRLWIRSGSGGSAPELIRPDRPTVFSARLFPSAPGKVRWLPLGGNDVRLLGPEEASSIELIASADSLANLAICAAYTDPGSGATVLAAHRFATHPFARSSEELDLEAPAAPVVVAAGWSRGRVRAGASVDLVARIEGGAIGQRVTFEITTTGDFGGVPLESLDVPLGSDTLVRIPWQIPESIPGEVAALGFTVHLGGVSSAAAGTEEEALDGRLFAELHLMSTLRMTLTDSRGVPLGGVPFQLCTLDGEVVDGASGRSAANGEITIADLLAQPYTLVLDEALVIDASEEPSPPRETPSPENTIFSFVDLRSAAEDDPGQEE